MDNERTTIQIRKQYWEVDNVKSKQKDEHEIEKTENNSDSDDDQIPEIKDIYDHIYGNVKTKRVFYENQKSQEKNDSKNSTCSVNDIQKNKNSEILVIQDEVALNNNEINVNRNAVMISHNEETITDSEKNINTFITNDSEKPEQHSLEKTFKPPTSPTFSVSEDDSILITNLSKPFDQISETGTETSSEASLPINQLSAQQLIPQKKSSNPDLLKSCEVSCNKCQKVEFINDRSEVLTEINASLKLELENVKKDLKQEMVRNNELNFEIANIESVLETYYKEAKNQKTTLASIYSTMKNYVSDNKSDFQESYTYKRIKMIANYMESLKNKLEHQDKVIKNNFIENPYYADLIIKHESILKQLDELSKENEELREGIKKKSSEELDTIKELNRQKFQLENRFKDMENFYKNEIVTREAAIKRAKDEHKKQLEDFQIVLDKKNEEIKKIEKTAAAKVNNYKQELVIVYRKWKEQTMTENT